MIPKITGGGVVLLLIKPIFFRCSWDLNIPLQSILLTLFDVYITFQHAFLIHLTFVVIHEYMITTYYIFFMFYIKYYMKDLNTYLKQFKVNIKKFIIVTYVTSPPLVWTWELNNHVQNSERCFRGRCISLRERAYDFNRYAQPRPGRVLYCVYKRFHRIFYIIY